ncbi:MAG: hypothetical protein COA42_23845 [Alteromonadaceae bacterium]|nr:MAG: hypothetical protein COA42_23845 [Alteromonadaceae bacterium]
MLPSLSADTVKAPSEGILIARVVSAGNTKLPFNQLTITPKNLNESENGKLQRLLALEPVQGSATLFTSPLAAGEYSLRNVRTFFYNTEGWYIDWVEAELKLGTFTVEPGKITDLGTLIYYPKVVGDKIFKTLIRSPSKADGSIITSQLPFLEYDPAEVLTWNDDGLEDERRAAYISAVRNPVVYNKQFKTEDNSVYFFGKLGALVKRTADQDWLIEAVDSDFDLISMAESDRGDLVVGGAFGSLFTKRVGSDEWARLALSSRYRVNQILAVEGTVIDLVVTTAKRVKILRGDLQALNPKWETISAYDPVYGWNDGSKKRSGTGNIYGRDYSRLKFLIVDTSLGKIDDKYSITVKMQKGLDYSMFNSTPTDHFFYDANTWKISNYQGSKEKIDRVIDAGLVDIGVHESDLFSVTGKDTYYVKGKSETTWQKVSTRVDNCPGINFISQCRVNGKATDHYSRFTFLSSPAFSTSQDAIAFVRLVPRYGAVSEDILTVATTDGGQSWVASEVKKPADYCASLVPEVSDALLVYCKGISSDFYQSDDQGQTWNHVREHESF